MTWLDVVLLVVWIVLAVVVVLGLISALWALLEHWSSDDE
jgi:hypothetical protein